MTTVVGEERRLELLRDSELLEISVVIGRAPI